LFALCLAENRELVAATPSKYANASFMPAKSRFVICRAPIWIGAAFGSVIFGHKRWCRLQDAQRNIFGDDRRDFVARAVRRQ
jgi:hypothetical protein